ncbi:MAG: DUF5666 domain-containing protein [Candidatus Shapirobacteria bacterium]|nr:DUF5666 domain-containing protein [Candidatus Shapirobacteria bacterium]MDD3002275.1 DUF5666 domain-containing protein [Candidatus Shapirobacteria bacterium]MDD4382720.1 DUF5666 domain-containing protein [Candidatus Shapirobacteria bacterium]
MCLFLSFIFSLFSPNQIFAKEATIAASTSDKNLTEEVRQMVSKKVKEIQQNDTGSSSVSTNTPKAIVGTISKIENNQITITNKNNSKIITTTDNTVFIDAKKNKIKIDNLKSGQVILSMGYYDQYNSFEAKRIIITASNAIENKNEIVFGKIADISQTSNVLVLIPIKNKNIQYQIKTDSKTKIIDKNENILTINKLKSGQKVIAIIQPDTKTANTFNVFQIITLDSSSDSTSPTPTPKK